MVFSSLKRVYLSYRKPGQTGTVIQRSFNTPGERFQSWSTNITRDNTMFLWEQSKRKWFSPGKLSLIHGLLRNCFILNEELKIANPSSCITLVCVACVFDRHRFGKNKQVPQNDALRKIHLIWFSDSSMCSVFLKQLPSSELKN